MSPRAILDANVVLAGIGWRRESHRVLILLARRRWQCFGTVETWSETERVASRLAASNKGFANRNWTGALSWLRDHTRIVDPAPLGGRRSRDIKDDRYLSAALGAPAAFVVTRDEDLLTLQKPFGVRCLTPREFLRILEG